MRIPVFIILLLSLLGSIIPFNGKIKYAHAECPEVSAYASLSFTYTRNGVQQGYSVSADSSNNINDSVEVDAGSVITEISYDINSVQAYGGMSYPGGYVYTDTNGYPYFYSGNNTPYGPLSSNPINGYSAITVSAGQGCNGADANIYVALVPGAAAPDFDISCSPSSQTITAGGTASFSVTTYGRNGFNSGVNISGSVSGSGNMPTISYYNNNGAAPNATTVAVISTSATTSGGTYTINFTGSGGGQSHSCSSQLQVNAQPASFTLSVTPSSTSVLKGNNAVFNVTANCGGSFTGPVTNLAASSFYTNVSYSFSAGSVNCGQTITLTVSNTGSVPSNQLSTPQTTLSQTITVTGQGSY